VAKPNTRSAFHKSNIAPDQTDVKALLNAFADDLGVYPELHVYQSLIGDVVIEAVCTVVDGDGSSSHHSTHMICSTVSPPMIVCMFRVLHTMYHEIDRKYVLSRPQSHALLFPRK